MSDLSKIRFGGTDYNVKDSTARTETEKKVTAAGGDVSNTKIVTADSITESYPVPTAGDTAKGFLGKVKKFCEDIRSTATGACFIGQIVNNCVSSNAKLPLSAAQGKVLMELYTQLNRDLNEYSVGLKMDAANCDDLINGAWLMNNPINGPGDDWWLIQSIGDRGTRKQLAHDLHNVYPSKTRHFAANTASAWENINSDLGMIRTATASDAKTVPDGGAIADLSISAGTWLIWGYANTKKVRIQDNDSNHKIYKAGLHPQSIISVTTNTNLQLININESSIDVWNDATNYYLMAMQLK